MNPWWTPWVAAYAALVSTAGLLWAIFRATSESKVSLRIDVAGDIEDGERRLYVVVTNLSEKRAVQIDAVALAYTHDASTWRTVPHKNLPFRLAPSQGQSTVVTEALLEGMKFSMVSAVGVRDSHGKYHESSRDAIQMVMREFLLAADGRLY